MIFDVYEPWKNKEGRIVPGVKPHPMEWSEIKAKVLARKDVREKIMAHREGKEGMKIQLPAICFVGRSTSTRKASAMVPTQLVMIDIDHCQDAEKAWEGDQGPADGRVRMGLVGGQRDGGSPDA